MKQFDLKTILALALIGMTALFGQKHAESIGFIMLTGERTSENTVLWGSLFYLALWVSVEMVWATVLGKFSQVTGSHRWGVYFYTATVYGLIIFANNFAPVMAREGFVLMLTYSFGVFVPAAGLAISVANKYTAPAGMTV